LGCKRSKEEKRIAANRGVGQGRFPRKREESPERPLQRRRAQGCFRLRRKELPGIKHNQVEDGEYASKKGGKAITPKVIPWSREGDFLGKRRRWRSLLLLLKRDVRDMFHRPMGGGEKRGRRSWGEKGGALVAKEENGWSYSVVRG